MLSGLLVIGIPYEVVNGIHQERHFLYGIEFIIVLGIAITSGIIIISIRNNEKRRKRLHSKYNYQ